MNKTELKAYNYLKKKGYNDIAFHEHSNPDFTTKESEYFEVKVISGKTITFYKLQYEYLINHPFTTILIYDIKSPLYDTGEPIYSILFNELDQFKDKVNVIIADNGSGDFTSIRIKLSTQNRLINYAKQYGVYRDTMDDIVAKLLDSAYRNKKKKENTDA